MVVCGFIFLVVETDDSLRLSIWRDALEAHNKSPQIQPSRCPEDSVYRLVLARTATTGLTEELFRLSEEMLTIFIFA